MNPSTMKIQFRIHFKEPVIFLALLMLIPAIARAGIELGNGGGIAEQNIEYACTTMDSSIAVCLKSAACVLDPAEKQLLEKIQKSLPEEIKMGSLLFKSGAKNPGLFDVSDSSQHRTVVTGDKVGSPIVFNEDLIYSDSGNGTKIPISISTAVRFLIHEFGHHQKVKDHQFLDRIGTKVSRVFDLNSSRETMAAALLDQVYVQNFNQSRNYREALDTGAMKSPQFSSFILSDGHSLFDLWPYIKDKAFNIRDGLFVNNYDFTKGINHEKLIYYSFSELRFPGLNRWDTNCQGPARLTGKLEALYAYDDLDIRNGWRVLTSDFEMTINFDQGSFCGRPDERMFFRGMDDPLARPDDVTFKRTGTCDSVTMVPRAFKEGPGTYEETNVFHCDNW